MRGTRAELMSDIVKVSWIRGWEGRLSSTVEISKVSNAFLYIIYLESELRICLVVFGQR